MHKFTIRKLDIKKVNKDMSENLTKLVDDSEDYYHRQIKDIVKNVSANNKIKLVLVSGPSSAGKTTSSNIIKSELERNGFSSIIISLDDFYINRINTPKFPDGSYDFENITTLDLPLLNKFIDNLLQFHKAKMPTFNFITGERESTWKDIEIDNHTIVIIEGLHALNPKLIRSHKKEIYKVYVNLNANYIINNTTLLSGKKVRLLRRITRDFYTRGYSALETLNNWKNVCDGEDKWVKPFKKTADYIIDSVHEYEILLYANYSKPILKSLILNSNVISLIESEYSLDKKSLLLNRIYIAKELYKSLSYSSRINKKIVPKNSLLLEFIGNAEDFIEPLGEIFN